MQKSDILSKSMPATSLIPEFRTDPHLGEATPDCDSNANTVSMRKIKSERSEETRKSNLITNSDMKNSRKEQMDGEQAYFLEHSFESAIN